MRKITEIILHCSATAEGLDFSVRDIRAWHKAQGWKDVGYHYVVRLDGTVQEGRPLEQAGAHCKGHNDRSIGICYIGGLDAKDRSPKDTRTPSQRIALEALVLLLRLRFPRATVHGHKEFAAKGSTTIKVFAKENVHYAPNALSGFNEADADGIIRLVNGRIILKKIKVPHYERNVKVDIKTTIASNGDRWDKSGSVFVLPRHSAIIL